MMDNSYPWELPKELIIIKQTIGKLRNTLELTQSGSNEHFCLTLRRGLELSAANSKIKDFESESALIVEFLDL